MQLKTEITVKIFLNVKEYPLLGLLESKEMTALERGDSVMTRVGPRFKTNGTGLTLQNDDHYKNTECII